MRRASYAAVFVASVLVVAKTVAWLMTDSIAMLSSLVDSLLDVVASGVNLIAIRHALVPADAEHRFGHGKAEPLAGLGQAVFIGGSAVFLLFEALNRLIHPQPVHDEMIGVSVMLVSIVLTLMLVSYQRYVIRKSGSVAVAADSVHYKADLLVNVGVIAGLLATMTLGWPIVDPLVAICVAGYISYCAWEIFQTSYKMLMDHELPEEDRQRIKDIVHAHPEVRSMHDLRTRSSGLNTFIQLHLEMDGNMTLLEAHHIADEIELQVQEAFPDAEVMIHQDPEGLEEIPPHLA
ncbi:MAG: divalent metal cation transporter FieF [Alphaproteobacteria bacterium]|nr:divalent metal cation transporter FieF [Alphaproteobacteria bacterium]